MKFPRKASVASAIDLTPMLDVVFLLLVFFMVSTRFDRVREVPIDLPDTAPGQALPTPGSKRVQMRADGTLLVNGSAVARAAGPANRKVVQSFMRRYHTSGRI